MTHQIPLEGHELNWLRLAGLNAGSIIADCLDRYGSSADDAISFRLVAARLLEMRGDAMLLVDRPDWRASYDHLAWEEIEKRLPGILADKAARPSVS